MLNGAAVSWQSTRQQVTALSTAEAEYYAASIAGTDVRYMSRIMDYLGFPQQDPQQEHGLYLHVADLSDVSQGEAHRYACLSSTGALQGWRAGVGESGVG
eukprot:2045132-Rhodomonas_salina.1